MIEDLLKEVPELENYIRYMPEELKHRYTIRVYPPGQVIHQKDFELDYFGLIVKGESRVINEFQNGNIFVIEKNKAIDFVGEVAILAGMRKASVTIETLTETTVLYFHRRDFEDWIAEDIHLLRLITEKIAYKLYRSSYNRGARLFYPPRYILLDYVLKYAASKQIQQKGQAVIRKTRQELCEECGIMIKTLNRSIKKLEEDGIVTVYKGKMTMTEEQYRLAQLEMERFLSSGNGS